MSERNTISELNIRLSILRFLNNYIATPYSLTLFVNDPATEDDESLMKTLLRFLCITITPRDTPRGPECISQQRVGFYLYSAKSGDTGGYWLRTMTQSIIDIVMQTTTANNLIALYDYERWCDVDTFLTSGSYSEIVAVTTATPEVIPGTGFYPQIGTAGVAFNTQADPMEAKWTMTFRHFAPDRQVGQRG